MERSDRPDRRERKKRRHASPSRGQNDEGPPKRQDRRRSQSPRAREPRDHVNDGGKRTYRERDDDRNQRPRGTRPANASIERSDRTHNHGRDGHGRANHRDNTQHGVNRNGNAPQATRGRENVGHGQSKSAASGQNSSSSAGGSSSMPFIRNDKPYQYSFMDDPTVKLAQELGEVPDDATLRKVMGFAKFRTSHELKIPDNEHNHGIRTVKQAQYRQYMNRRNGFNRPLSPPHD